MRVVIVEDEYLVAEGLCAALQEEGFEVVGIAGKLDKALRLIEQKGFDIAIIDANLRGVSAEPVASYLKARNRPFVVLSGYADEQLGEQLRGAAYVRKPYHLRELVRCLRRSVGRVVAQT
jgi:DNA-binding response OmpR family regulator